MSASMLTTIDNPYSPFTQYDEWYAFDVNQGYNTCSYLARIAKTSDELSEEDEDQAIEAAIDKIVRLNVLGLYKKVYLDNSEVENKSL
jgi:hypothetical protein